jgi:hypothetical protein
LLYLLALSSLLASDDAWPQFEVRTGKYVISISQAEVKRDVHCWGFDPYFEMPATKIGISIKKEGQTYYPSFSAYSDLSSLHAVEWKMNGDRLVVTGNGGDAHAGYSVKWTFRNGALARREVRASEFPENEYEITEYVYKPYED